MFTHRPPAERDGVTFWDASPLEAYEHWSRLGIGRTYVDGGFLISSFLDEGLIADMTLTKVPILLGSGWPLFHLIKRRNDFELRNVQRFPSGMMNLSYVHR